MNTPVSGSAVSDEQIDAAITAAVQQGALTWTGFRQDADGRYTLPMVSQKHYDFARAVLALTQPAVPVLASEPEPVAAEQARPGCSCESCFPQGDGFSRSMRMIVCATCGNKRCPHATDHRNTCTQSNEPGQKGSSWEGFSGALASQSTPPPESAAQGLSDAGYKRGYDLGWRTGFRDKAVSIMKKEVKAQEALKAAANYIDTLIDIHGAVETGNSDERCYVPEAWSEILTTTRRLLLAANPKAQPDGGSKA